MKLVGRRDCRVFAWALIDWFWRTFLVYTPPVFLGLLTTVICGMKGCRIFHGRSAGRYLKCSNWNYSTSASKSIANAKDFKNVTSSSATTCDLSQGGRADGIQTTTVEGTEGQRDGNGKGNKRRELPLSPLMDPLFQEARNKHSAPKPQPKKEDRTAFQEQLAKNPYGIIVSNYL